MRYLPRKFKDVKIYNPSKTYDGYSLFATMWGQDAWLIDMEGNVANHWLMKNMPGCHGRLLPNGNLLWQGRSVETLEGFEGNATEIVEVDWEGNEVWRYEDKFINHDFIRLENGNTLLNRYVEIPYKISSQIKGGLAGTEHEGRKIYSCSFQEITKEGKIVWEWRHYEHLNLEKDIICPLCPRSIWGYTNAMDIFPNGNILFTLRFLNTVAILDKNTGEIIWRWGPDQCIGHPHDCSVLPNGNILLFDNGFHRKPTKSVDSMLSEEEYSRILEINPKTNEIVWEYNDRLNVFYSPTCGGAQRLPNGNTLICESLKGRFFEVTREKEIVWEYVNPFLTKRTPYWNYSWQETRETFRVHRYGLDFEAFNGKDLNNKFEWKIVKKEQKTDKEREEEEIFSRLTRLGY